MFGWTEPRGQYGLNLIASSMFVSHAAALGKWAYNLSGFNQYGKCISLIATIVATDS